MKCAATEKVVHDQWPPITHTGLILSLRPANERRRYNDHAILGADGNARWRHQMETFSALLAFVRGIHRSLVNSPHKGQWCGALMFSLFCAWTNGCANNRDAGDLRRNCPHYDVTVMGIAIFRMHPMLFLFEILCNNVSFIVGHLMSRAHDIDPYPNFHTIQLM